MPEEGDSDEGGDNRGHAHPDRQIEKLPLVVEIVNMRPGRYKGNMPNRTDRVQLVLGSSLSLVPPQHVAETRRHYIIGHFRVSTTQPIKLIALRKTHYPVGGRELALVMV